VSDLHFDPYQFAGRGRFPVSAATSIAFTDYQRMHTETHNVNPAAWVPPFALNDKQLQKVLLLRAWRYTHKRGRPQEADRDKINADATAKALKGNSVAADAPAIQREMVKAHIAAVRKAGGYMQLHAAISFRSWRLGLNSPEVAESLGMTPYAVRVALWRLRDAAKELGFDVGRVGHTAGTKRKPPKPQRKPKRECRRGRPQLIDSARAVALYHRGMSLTDIAVQFGYKRWTGLGSVRHALLVAGVYKWKWKSRA
jgi:hypothetical protein